MRGKKLVIKFQRLAFVGSRSIIKHVLFRDSKTEEDLLSRPGDRRFQVVCQSTGSSTTHKYTCTGSSFLYPNREHVFVGHDNDSKIRCVRAGDREACSFSRSLVRNYQHRRACSFEIPVIKVEIS